MPSLKKVPFGVASVSGPVLFCKPFVKMVHKIFVGIVLGIYRLHNSQWVCAGFLRLMADGLGFGL